MFKRRASVKLFERPPGFDERLLREVFEAMRVALVTMQDREYARLMPPDNLGKFIRRAAANPVEKLGFIAHRWFDMAELTAGVEALFQHGSCLAFTRPAVR